MPHFLYGDHSLTKNVIGLEPNDRTHQFYVDVHPLLGIVGQIQVQMQINIAVRQDHQLEWTKRQMAPLIYYPMIWFEARAQLDDSSVRELQLLGNLTTFLVIIGLTSIGFGLLLVTVAIYCQWEALMFKCANTSNANRNKRVTSTDAVRASETRNLTVTVPSVFRMEPRKMH